MGATRTHVHYFGEDELAPLLLAAAELRSDWLDRAPHVPEPIRARGELRLDVLDAALALLGEPAD